MTKQDAIAIRFNTGRAIAIDEAFNYADDYNGEKGYASPVEVIWSDGSWSFAKGWWDTRRNHILCEIGAGAYGTMRIMER